MSTFARLLVVSIGCSALALWQCGGDGSSGGDGGKTSGGGTGAKSGGAGGKDGSTGGGGSGGSGGTSLTGGAAGTSAGGAAGTATGGAAGTSAGGVAGSSVGGAAGSSTGGSGGGDASLGGSGGADASTGGTGGGGTGGADAGVEAQAPICTVQVSVGGEHTCAVKIDGSVWCWGADQYGQLGDGTITGSQLCYGQVPCNPTPAMVSGLSSGYAQVSIGASHSCARTSGGGLVCWGHNSNGELGTGTTDGVTCGFSTLDKCKLTPQPVSGLTTGVTDVSVGPSSGSGEGTFSCALKTDFSVWCWGGGYLGFGGYGPTPVQITGLASGVEQLSTGGGFGCVLKKDGTVWCWGANNVGQLGDGSTTTSQTPVKVALDYTKPWVRVAAGGDHACAIRSDLTTWCWGGNLSGQIGIGTKTTAVPIPQLVIGMGLTSLDIVAGKGNTCGRKYDLTYWCWGEGSDGQLGIGVGSPSAPSPVSALSNTFFGVDLGNRHSCAIKAGDGSLWCYGDQIRGQIGNGNAYGPNVCTQTPQFCTQTPTKTKLSCP